MAEEDAARWDGKYAGRPAPIAGASEAVRRIAGWLPAHGRVLDLAGGDGAQAVWLAQRGLSVTLCDISVVALQRAEALAESEAVTLRAVRADLERDGCPAGPWDAVLCTNYLQASLWPAVAQALSVGGVALWVHPTVENLTRHAKPSRRFLLEPGQGRSIFEGAGLSILHAEEAWIADRHVSCVVGRRDA